MKKGQKYLGTVLSLALSQGCTEQLRDGVTIFKIFEKRLNKKNLVRVLPLPENVSVYTSDRLTSLGGYADCNDDTITLNKALVDGKHLNGEFCITLIHEYAHLVAYALYKAKGHDNSWRYCMDMLNLPPNIYHSNTDDFKAVREAQGEEALNDLLDEIL